MKSIVLFAATRWEYNALCRAVQSVTASRVGKHPCMRGRKGQAEVWVVQTGVGMAHATQAVRDVLETQPFTVIISTGFACALTRANVGDLLIGTEVLVRGEGQAPSAAGDVIPSSPALCATALKIAAQANFPAHAGRLLAVPHIVVSAQVKAQLASASHAIGLDMESAAIGEAANERKIPFLAVRTASDLVDEDLPVDFNRFLDPRSWLGGFLALLVSPPCWVAINRLRRQSRVASLRLTSFFDRFLEAVA